VEEVQADEEARREGLRPGEGPYWVGQPLEHASDQADDFLAISGLAGVVELGVEGRKLPDASDGGMLEVPGERRRLDFVGQFPKQDRKRIAH
jgi:hypothetical protein